MHAIVSIHDVMPQTLNRVMELLDKMAHLDSENITLLVVPGFDWQPAQLKTLEGLQSAGYRLAGHGWHHKTRAIRTLYHQLHAGLVSRTAAEHLSLNTREIIQLLGDCHDWFTDKGLNAPDLYVPPAWAMGNISRKQLGQTPFRYFESTSGLYDSHTGRQIVLPLVGFEADTRLRAASLKCWNGANRLLGSARRPLRLSIHPGDHQLLLKQSLDHYLTRISSAIPYQSVFRPER